VLMLPG